jgi:4-amino-4-deoxy-L-arabinose transferase-like glycosyltransferase
MKFFIKYSAIFLLVLIIIFHIVVNFIWLKIDNIPPSWDPANHMLQSMWMFDNIKNPHLLFENGLKCDGCYHLYPPLTGFVVSLFYLFLGVGIDNAILAINIIFLSLLIICTYKIGKILSDHKVGLLAAFLVSMYPFTYITSRQYFLDIPLAAMVTLAIYILIKTNNFKCIKYSFIFGVISGLGLLTKEAFFLLIIGPLCCSFFYVRSIRQVKNIIYALIICVILASAWYLPLFTYSKGYIQGFCAGKDGPPLFSMDSLLYYFKIFVINQGSLLYGFLFIASFVLIKDWDKRKKIVLQWIIFALIIFTFLKVKQERYTIPILPAIALISACGVMSINKVFLKRLLVCILVIYSLAQFILQSTGIVKLDRYFNNNSVYGHMCRDYFRGWQGGWFPYPMRIKLEIIDDMLNALRFRNSPASDPIYLISSNCVINEYTLRYLFKMRQKELDFYCLAFNGNPLKLMKEAEDGAMFIYVDTYQKEMFSGKISKMLKWMKCRKKGFDLVFQGAYLDGSRTNIFIYKK